MNIRYLRAGCLAGLCLALILLSGACDNPANSDDKDTTTTAVMAAQNAADSFYDAHRGVLDRPADMLTLDDAAPVNAALEGYKNLRGDVKTLLAGEKAHLDLLKTKLDEMLAEAERGTYYNLTDVLVYLVEQPDNTADTPYSVAYYGNETIKAFYRVLALAGKYTALDLSRSGVRGFATGTEAGREFIVSLVLPDTLTETPVGRRTAPVFAGFTSLKTVSATGLVTLGAYAFYGCTSLVSVTLSAASIGDYAFNGCTSLTAAILPEAVSIGQYAFYNCPSLATANLPKAESLGNYAFGYTNLTTVSLPEAATLGIGVFYSCTSLATANLPKAESLGNYVFYSASLTTVNLPKAVILGSSVFSFCTSLAAVTLPEAVTIGGGAFGGCTSLATITLPKAESIDGSAFADCTGLAAITLPKAESIGNTAFQNCTSLATVTLGIIPPAIGTRIFQGAAATAKTITIKAPQLTLYTTISPWTDKIGANASAGEYWDNLAATKANLTVALAPL
jgi:hypothetical protein